MLTDLTFAIVGCGRIAARHAELMTARGNLVTVCDIDVLKADRLATLYNAIPYYKLEDMLEMERNIDVIAVCTPNGLHALHTIQCLEAGHHVLCEKPMALHATDCATMIKTARKNKRQLFIVKQNRFNPPVAALKKLVDDGRLGDIYSFQMNCFWNREATYYKDSWKGSREMDGGTLYTQFSHFIDLLYWILGEVTEVKAIFKNYAHGGIIEFEDTGFVLLEFEKEVTGCLNYTVNSFEKNFEGSLTLLGEKGTVKIGGLYLNKLEYQNIKGYTIPDLPTGAAANIYENYEGSMGNHHKVYDNLVDVLQNGACMATSGEEGMKTVEIIEKIYNTANRL